MLQRRLRPQTRLYRQKVNSWLGCLLKGVQRRRLRQRTESAFGSHSAECLEDRTLLSAVAFEELVIDDMLDGASNVEAVDIDGDGDLDLLAIGNNVDTVAWYENDGAAVPSFTRYDIATDRDGASQALSADLDNDGDMDVVVASAGDNTITWYENDGNQNFTEVEISTALIGATAIDLVDLDQDGDLDIVGGGTGIDWFENDGAIDPAFTLITLDLTSAGVKSLTTEDIDADGDLDVAAASSGDDTVAWFENDGNENFTKNTLGTNVGNARDVQVTDLDGDGDLDIVAAAKDDDRVHWFESNGAVNPTFVNSILFSGADLNGVTSLAPTDVDRDGDMDLVVASPNAAKLVWLENDGDMFLPTFSLNEITDTVSGIQDVIIADVDGDGNKDLVTAQFTDDTISWFRNRSIHQSTFFPNPFEVTNLSDGTYSVKMGDIDGDGDMDIVASSVYDNSVRWYEQDSEESVPTFTARTISTVSNGPRGIHLADIDYDGDLDVIVASAVQNSIAVWTNVNGDGTLWGTDILTVSAFAARDVFAADMNGDGLLDVLSASSGDDTIRWFQSTPFNPASPFIERTIATNADGARSVFAADLDGDGDMDAMSASYYDDKIVWYQNIAIDGAFGDITWARRTISTDVDGARSIYAADIDNDGDIDILTASTYDNSIRWFENDGSALIPSFTERLLSNGEQGAQFVTAFDVDQDGDLDVVSVAAFPDVQDVSRIAWFENDGASNPTFTRNTIDTRNDRPISAALGDLDSDGLIDVVSGSMLDDTVIAYYNEGGQIRFDSQDTTPGFFPAGDFDDVMKITATHLGQPGDSDIEIVSFDLGFEETSGDPLTSVEVNNLIFNLKIFLDNGDGVFDVDDDSLIKTIDPLVLDPDGVLTVSFTDGDPNVQISQGTPRSYFVVVELTANAFIQDPNQFILTHLTTNTTQAEDAVTDLPVKLELVPNFSTGIIQADPPNVPKPGSTTFVAPIGITTDSTPTIQWNSAVGADVYDLLVRNLSTGRTVFNLTNFSGTSFTPTSPLPVGDSFEMLVRGVNVAGERGNFSPAEYFTIDNPVIPPAAPTLTGPAENIEDTTPTITWTAETGADSYDLLIYNVRLGVEVLNETSIPTAWFATTSVLTEDLHQVFVRARNAGGPSNYSTPLLFNTIVTVPAPVVPILTGPASNIPTLIPTITWKKVPGAINHQVLIYSISRGQEVRNVSNIAGEEFSIGAPLPGADTYQVFVRANMGGGIFSGFSDPLVFVAESGDPLPSRTTVRTPTGQTTDSMPTFIWDRIPEAETYELVMYNVVTGQEVMFVSGITSRSFIPGAPLSPSTYQVHVRGLNSFGEAGYWSARHRFDVVAMLENDLLDNATDAETEILELETEELPGESTILEERKDDVLIAELGEKSPAFQTMEQAEPEAVAQIDSFMSQWHEAEWWENEETPAVSEQTSDHGLALGAAALFLGTNSLKKVRNSKKRSFFHRKK